MIAFIHKRKADLRKRLDETRITVRGHIMRFNIETTRWLGMYLDTGLQLRAHKNVSLERSRRAGGRVWRL